MCSYLPTESMFVYLSVLVPYACMNPVNIRYGCALRVSMIRLRRRIETSQESTTIATLLPTSRATRLSLTDGYRKVSAQSPLWVLLVPSMPELPNACMQEEVISCCNPEHSLCLRSTSNVRHSSRGVATQILLVSTFNPAIKQKAFLSARLTVSGKTGHRKLDILYCRGAQPVVREGGHVARGAF